jgi:hypothetical protein
MSRQPRIGVPCDLGTPFPVVPVPRPETKFPGRGTCPRSAFPASKIWATGSLISELSRQLYEQTGV